MKILDFSSRPRIAAGLALGLALVACDRASLGDDVVIGAGDELAGGAATVNGSIRVGQEAVAGGTLKTINGSVRIEPGAKVANIASVNGKIVIGTGASTGNIDAVNGSTDCEENARVKGHIELVNGPVRMQKGVRVSGNVKTVNGPIRLSGAVVEGNINNYNGGIVITDSSLVHGDVIVSKPQGLSMEREPVVILGPGSEVRGAMTFERPVKLYVHDGARHGTITGADPVSFSGDKLPEDG